MVGGGVGGEGERELEHICLRIEFVSMTYRDCGGCGSMVTARQDCVIISDGWCDHTAPCQEHY